MCAGYGGRNSPKERSLRRQTNDWQLTSVTLRRLNAESRRVRFYSDQPLDARNLGGAKSAPTRASIFFAPPTRLKGRGSGFHPTDFSRTYATLSACHQSPSYRIVLWFREILGALCRAAADFGFNPSTRRYILHCKCAL